MWRMTRTAFTIINRLVLGQSALLPRNGIGMTAAADLLHWRLHQARCRGSVRRMAVQAPCIVDQGPVNLVLVKRVVDHVVVAALTQFVTILEGRQRSLGR